MGKELRVRGNLICVGDFVSRLCSEREGEKVLVLDGVTRRSDAVEVRLPAGLPTYELRNDRGTLSLQAYGLLCRLVARGESAALLVRGEEDMVALAAIACSRPGWSAIYGMPGKGSCVVPHSPLTARMAQTRVLQLKP